MQRVSLDSLADNFDGAGARRNAVKPAHLRRYCVQTALEFASETSEADTLALPRFQRNISLAKSDVLRGQPDKKKASSANWPAYGKCRGSRGSSLSYLEPRIARERDALSSCSLSLSALGPVVRSSLGQALVSPAF